MDGRPSPENKYVYAEELPGYENQLFRTPIKRKHYQIGEASFEIIQNETPTKHRKGKN